ncbi:MAG: sigma-70 family RNA polymerase sigma factor [bacterium]|nr:sigma-70 family RNA polymerase sigma factor [bacterium]MDO5462978.1 sigma-70 family RNA polymerase sigma factor [bacterium]
MASLVPDTPQTLLKILTAEEASDPQWHRFVTLYTPVIRAWLKLHGLPPAEADDAQQEVFIRLIRNLRGQSYDQARSRFRTYLSTLVRNIAIDHLRRHRATQKHHTYSSEEDAVLATPADAVEVPFQIDAQFRLAVYEAALEGLRQDPTLTPLELEVLQHSILGEIPLTQLAQTSSHSYTKLYRTKQNLLQRLQQRIDIWLL